MKGEIMPSIVQIDRQHLNELTHEVKETLATELTGDNAQEATKSFCAVDLWKIQNMKKSANLRFKSNF
ncbi:MAG: hypothetical protein I8H66_06330 [Sphingobacteriia bacterium]|nr:hypothetical protein [Sphingobacteriia bacterium]